MAASKLNLADSMQQRRACRSSLVAPMFTSEPLRRFSAPSQGQFLAVTLGLDLPEPKRKPYGFFRAGLFFATMDSCRTGPVKSLPAQVSPGMSCGAEARRLPRWSRSTRLPRTQPRSITFPPPPTKLIRAHPEKASKLQGYRNQPRGPSTTFGYRLTALRMTVVWISEKCSQWISPARLCGRFPC